MKVVGVEYPATDDFERSSAVGARWTVDYVKAKAVECPNAKFAFGGYSQGGQVVHKARAGLHATAYQNKIVGATLWGDPYMMACECPFVGVSKAYADSDAAGALARIPPSWYGKILDNCAPVS